MVRAMLVIASEAPFKTLVGSFIAFACEKTPFMGVARNQMALSHMSCLWIWLIDSSDTVMIEYLFTEKGQ